MDIEQNVGGRDRAVRALLAILLLGVAIQAIRGGNRRRAALAGVAAAGLAINAVTCFCGLNRALGIDTTGDK